MVEKVVKSLEEMQVAETEGFADIVDGKQSVESTNPLGGDFGGDLDEEDFEIVDSGRANEEDDKFD